MSTHPRTVATPAPHAQPWAWTRASAFASASVAIGAAKHAVSGSTFDATSVALLLFVWVMLTAYARVFAGERMTMRVMIPALIAGQLAVHTLMVLTMPTAVHHQELGHTAMAHESAFGIPSISMILFHVAATLLGAALLKRLDQRAWRTVRAAVRAVVVALCEFLASFGAPRTIGRVRARRAIVLRTPAQQWVSRALGRRGPPCAIALH